MTRQRICRRRRSVVGGLVVALAAALTGCSNLHPGAAAVVGSRSIEASTVDAIASAYCQVTAAAARAQGSPAAAQPTRDLRRGVLNALVQDRVVSGAAGRLGGIRVPASQIDQLVDSSGILSQPVAGDAASVLHGFLDKVASTQLKLEQIGRRLATEQPGGGQAPSPEQASAAARRYVLQYAADLDVRVDPRYGSYSPRGIEVSSGSLSVPVSDEALLAVRPTLDAATARTLPASQTCA